MPSNHGTPVRMNWSMIDIISGPAFTQLCNFTIVANLIRYRTTYSASFAFFEALYEVRHCYVGILCNASANQHWAD